jgi:hypothetical protein
MYARIGWQHGELEQSRVYHARLFARSSRMCLSHGPLLILARAADPIPRALPRAAARPLPQLTECAPGHEVEALLQACAGLEAGVAWDRVRDDVLALEQQQQAAHAALVLAGGAVDGAGAAEGGFGAVPFGSKRGLEGGYTGVPKPAGRMGAIGLGKRPRALVSPTMTPRAAGGGAGGAPGCSSVSHAEMRRRSALTEMCMRGEAEWDSVLTEATVPTREQLLSGPPAERVPAASLRVLALLESAGVGGQHEGAVVTQLLELIHRHVAGILADATACCVHRVEAPDFAVAAAEGACVLASDVHMAVELDLVTLAHVAPPPRDVLAATGCCAINALPLPLFPDDGLGVVLPPQAERLASLRN